MESSPGDGTAIRLTYELDPEAQLGLDDIRAEIAAFFEEGVSDPLVREDAEAAGVDLDAVTSDPPELTVEGADGRLSGVVEAIVIAAAVKTTEKLIDEVIVPWLRRRRGHTAIRGSHERMD